MKVIAIRNDKTAIKIGESDTSSEWYSVGQNVQNFVKTLRWGDEIEIKFEQGEKQKTLTFVKKADKAPAPAPAPVTGTSSPEPEKPKSTYKSSETSEQIRRLAVGHMVSRTLIGLSPQLTLDNVEEIINKLWNIYEKKS